MTREQYISWVYGQLGCTTNHQVSRQFATKVVDEMIAKGDLKVTPERVWAKEEILDFAKDTGLGQYCRNCGITKKGHEHYDRLNLSCPTMYARYEPFIK